MKIKLEERVLPILKNRGMNRSVLASKPFEFKPISFTSNIEGLVPKMFKAKKQLKWFQDFLDNPFEPRSYCLVSAPNDAQAKLLAAFMMQHAAVHGSRTQALPLWHDLTGGFNNPLLNEKNVKASNCSLLVLNNVGAQSTQPKLEKLRDIIESYPGIPKVIVATGCDPFMFFTRHLYLPVHALAYLTNNTVKKNITI